MHHCCFVLLLPRVGVVAEVVAGVVAGVVAEVVAGVAVAVAETVVVVAVAVAVAISSVNATVFPGLEIVRGTETFFEWVLTLELLVLESWA